MRLTFSLETARLLLGRDLRLAQRRDLRFELPDPRVVGPWLLLAAQLSHDAEDDGSSDDHRRRDRDHRDVDKVHSTLRSLDAASLVDHARKPAAHLSIPARWGSERRTSPRHGDHQLMATFPFVTCTPPFITTPVAAGSAYDEPPPPPPAPS